MLSVSRTILEIMMTGKPIGGIMAAQISGNTVRTLGSFASSDSKPSDYTSSINTDKGIAKPGKITGRAMAGIPYIPNV